MVNQMLENEFLKVAVADTGAEWTSVWDKTAGHKCIWNANPAVWNRHALILFPCVGKVKDGKYRIGENKYSMKTQHGFIRDQVFTCVEKTEVSVTHCLVDSEQTRDIYPIAAEDVAQVLKNAAGLGRPVSVATRRRLAANGWDQDLADYYRLAKLELTVAPDFDAACREDVYQLLLGCREEDHPAIIRDAQGVKIAVSWDRAVDVIPASSGKGAAITKVLEHFGLDAAQAMAFGDSQNDLEMLRAVGVGVAMGNASPRAKEAADRICGTVSEDGIYHCCVAQGLIEAI